MRPISDVHSSCRGANYHCFHPCFDRPDGVLNGLTPPALPFRMFQRLLHRFENMLMLPSGDPSLRAGSTAMFDGAASPRVGPVAAQAQSAFLSCEAVGKPFASRTFR